MKFNLSTLTQGTDWGWVIAMTVVGPLLLWVINVLFMGGNKEAGKYAQRYIQESDTIVVSLDCDCEFGGATVTSFFSRGDAGNIRYDTYIFYSNESKKYMCINTFSSFNIQRLYKNDGSGSYTRDVDYYHDLRSMFISHLLRGEKLVSFRVNRKQWNDPTYGTKENPMPIFWLKALSYHPDDRFIAIVSDEVNEKFVECYLN